MGKLNRLFGPTARLFAVLLMVAPACFAQDVPVMAADAKPTFDVATIKPSQPEEKRVVQVRGTRLFTEGTSLVDLIVFAYRVHSLQVIDGPDWIKSEKFDLVMQPNMPGRPSTDQMRSMLQNLLADRFMLTFHQARKELPVYRIVVAKAGPKLTPAPVESTVTNTASIFFSDRGMTVRNATVAEFANLLQRYVDLERPVMDNTGILGKYDFNLSWTPDFSQFNGKAPWVTSNEANAPPGLYTAIEEQLGLKLEAVKQLTDVLVVDRVQKPSEN